MPSIADRYPDLLPSDADAALATLIGDLDRAYSTTQPVATPSPYLRAAIAHTLQERASALSQAPSAGRGGSSWWSRRRTGLTALLAVALLGGGTVAGLALTNPPDPYPSNMFPSLANTTSLLNTYGHSYDTSRSACGYTVTLTSAYADADRVIVRYTIHGSRGRTFLAVNGAGVSMLRAAHGVAESALGSVTSSKMVRNVGMADVAFNARRLIPVAGRFNLQWTVSHIWLAEQLQGITAAQHRCETYLDNGPLIAMARASWLDRLRGIGAKFLPGVITSPLGRLVEVRHSFTIRFSVPVDPVQVRVSPIMR